MVNTRQSAAPSRTRALVRAAAIVAIAAAPALQQCGPGIREARQVILISLDTCRADHMGAYGYPDPTSPHFDAWAKQGVLFHDCTSPLPIPLPSH